MSTLRIGALQYGVTRIESLDDYATKLDTLVATGVADGGQLLLMPEYAPMELAAATCVDAAAHAELLAVCRDAPAILEIMRATARRHAVWLMPGTLPWGDGEIVRNRAPLIAPDGSVAWQDKRVMTRFESETWRVSPGDEPGVFETPWGMIGLAICYDLEFPALVRTQTEAGAWLILAPSCTDTMHGFERVRLAARARAMENQCYVVMSPTVSQAPWLATLDENRGCAGAYGPVDRGFPPDGVLVEGKLDAPGWIFADLDRSRLDEVRRDGAVRNHRDHPERPSPSRVLARDAGTMP